jgi:hypothetical protein
MSDATLSGPAWEDLAAELQVCPQLPAAGLSRVLIRAVSWLMLRLASTWRDPDAGLSPRAADSRQRYAEAR